MNEKILVLNDKLLLADNKIICAPQVENLQNKTVDPAFTSQTVMPDEGYVGLSSVVVTAIPTATQAIPSITVSSSGLITASATQTAGYVSAGTKSATKQLTVQAAQTITPGTSNKTIASGRYLTGTQTIKGDSNLIPENIAKDISIFGVVGTLENTADNTEPFAIITATFPIGNTCTCTHSVTGEILNTTPIVVDSKNVGFFTIPEAGQWIITINDGQQTKSERITITTQGQTATIELSYDVLYIVSEERGLAMGYSPEGNLWVEDNTIGITSPETVAYSGYLSPMIDVTEYNTMYIDAYWGASSVGVGETEDGWQFDAVANPDSWDRRIAELDISDISGNTYIKVSANNWGSYITIYNLWLTK